MPAPWKEELVYKGAFVGGFWLIYLAVQGSLGLVLDYWDLMPPLFVGDLCILGLAGFPSTLCAVLVSRLVVRIPLALLPLGFLAAYPLEILEAVLFRFFLGTPGLWSYEGDELIRVFFLLFYASTFYLALIGGLVAIEFYLRWRREVLAKARATALAHEAQVAMLRYQLNPHFLFNTLNSMSALILERRNDDADRMVRMLSRFLRRTVDAKADSKIPLQKELETIHDYLEVEKVRFGDRLRYTVNASEQAQTCLVPSLLIQPLVENAMRHAVANRVGDGRIEIAADVADGRLVVRVGDDGPGFDDPAGVLDRPTGVGLRNVADRLASIYHGQARLSAVNPPTGGAVARIDLPAEGSP